MPTSLPKNVELERDSQKHQFVRQQLIDRFNFSRQHVNARQETYEEQENQFLAYIHERDIDRQTKARSKAGEPMYTTLRIPYTYGEIMTMHTFYTTVMLGRNPILQFNGRHGESQRQKMAVEAIMNYQMLSGRNIVPLYIWLLDALKYGRGILWMDWEERYSYFIEEEDIPVLDELGLPSGETTTRDRTFKLLQYQGNKFFTSRPQEFLSDPRVPIAYLQSGEFVGRTFDLYMNDLIRGGREGIYFNVDRAKRLFKSSRDDMEQGDRSPKIDPVADHNPMTAGPPTGKAPAMEMYVELVPDDWQLKDFRMPQKWVFTLVDKDTIIEARPMGAYHDQFPCASMEPEFDGYSLHSRSPQEIIRPLEDTMTWLFNSHFFNVRRALNDQIVFDPTMIEPEDVFSPLPGGGIRAKPAAYGQDLRKSIYQLPVNDVTRAHIGDTGHVLSLLQRVDGVNDSVLGMIDQGGRRSATEARQGAQFSTSRLKSKSEFMSAQGFTPMGEISVQQTQQYFDQEMKFRVAGNLAQQGVDPFVDVSPESIAGAFDFIPVDGNQPLDRFALANLWRQIFSDMARLAQLPQMQEFDLLGIFRHFAQLAGATDIDQFRINMQDPEQLENEERRGNIVPLGGQSERGPPAEGDERAAARDAAPPQVSGLG